MSDEEKVIEKLVTGDKLFQPIPNKQTVSRPSRSVETSFEGIFWAFALLAFAVAIMLLINNTKWCNKPLPLYMEKNDDKKY